MTSPQWHDRLLPHAEAYEIGGTWPLVPRILDRDGARELHLTCGHCGQSAGVWYAAEAWNDAGKRTCPDDVLSAALRHAVMAHDEPLNRRARDERDSRRGAGPGGPGTAGGGGVPGGRHRDSGGPGDHRLPDQKPDHPGVRTASEGHRT